MSSNPKSVLQLRMQEKIQRVMLEFFSKGEMSIGGECFSISITNVDISPNLRNLKVYVDFSIKNDSSRYFKYKAIVL